MASVKIPLSQKRAIEFNPFDLPSGRDTSLKVLPQKRILVEQDLSYSTSILTYEELEQFLLEQYLYVPSFYGAEKERIQDLFKFCVVTYFEQDKSKISFISLISPFVTSEDTIDLSSLRAEDSFTSFEALVQETISGFPEVVPYNSLVAISPEGFFKPDLGKDSVSVIEELLKRVQKESEKKFLEELLKNITYFIELKKKHPNIFNYPIRPAP